MHPEATFFMHWIWVVVWKLVFQSLKNGLLIFILIIHLDGHGFEMFHEKTLILEREA